LCLATAEERLKIYDDVAGKFPKAYAPRRLPLDFLSGELPLCIVFEVTIETDDNKQVF
jgi:hypothetical protein